MLDSSLKQLHNPFYCYTGISKKYYIWWLLFAALDHLNFGWQVFMGLPVLRVFLITQPQPLSLQTRCTMLIRACQRYSPWRGGEAWLWRGLSWCSSSPKSVRARQEWRRYRGRGVWMEIQWIHKEFLTSEVCSCHLGLLHCFLNPLHDCSIQHLEVTGCPADGADWVTF